MPSEVIVIRWLVEPCIRCDWPVGSRFDGRWLATESAAQLAEDRHEFYCRQGVQDKGGKLPREFYRERFDPV